MAQVTMLVKMEQAHQGGQRDSQKREEKHEEEKHEEDHYVWA